MREAGRGVTVRIGARPSMSVLIASPSPLLLASCSGETAGSAQGPNPRKDIALIAKYGCGQCHTIPGIRQADGVVVPPLTAIASRVYIAGVLRNSPDNMVAWIEHPQRLVPGNAMPEMGIDHEQARDIAAYLDRLR
jgi:cytochrome c1